MFRSITRKYMLQSLFLLILIGIYAFSGLLFIRYIKGEARKINLAGRERMLTYSLAFNLQLLIDSQNLSNNDLIIKRIRDSMDEYEEVLYGLRNGSNKLALAPLHEHDTESLFNLDALITVWQGAQKPILLEAVKDPSNYKESAKAILSNLDNVELLVKSLEGHYDRQMEDFKFFTVSAVGIFLIGGIIASLYVRNKFVLPIVALRDAASEIERGNLDTRVDIKGEDELSSLGHNFNRMASTLEASLNETRKTAIENRQLIDGLDSKVRERTKELNDAMLKATAASKAKSDFIANISHELRTPLSTITGYSTLLEEEFFGELNEKQKDFVANITHSSTHLRGMINNILDLAKVESGKMELECRRFFLREALSQTIEMFRDAAFKRNIYLRFCIDPSADIEIEGDEIKLRQIMLNLLSNAIKFTPDGGKVNVAAEITEIENERSGIKVSMEDTGIGIKPEDMPRLFTEFTQLDSPYTKRYEGTGLGLYLTKRLVESQGGQIWAESKYGKGSRFIFSLPNMKYRENYPKNGR